MKRSQLKGDLVAVRDCALAIVMGLPPNELKALDCWIKADGGLLSRQQAIRRILSVALGTASGGGVQRRV